MTFVTCCSWLSVVVVVFLSLLRFCSSVPGFFHPTDDDLKELIGEGKDEAAALLRLSLFMAFQAPERRSRSPLDQTRPADISVELLKYQRIGMNDWKK